MIGLQDTTDWKEAPPGEQDRQGVLFELDSRTWNFKLEIWDWDWDLKLAVRNDDLRA